MTVLSYLKVEQAEIVQRRWVEGCQEFGLVLLGLQYKLTARSGSSTDYQKSDQGYSHNYCDKGHSVEAHSLSMTEHFDCRIKLAELERGVAVGDHQLTWRFNERAWRRKYVVSSHSFLFVTIDYGSTLLTIVEVGVSPVQNFDSIIAFLVRTFHLVYPLLNRLYSNGS